MEDTPAQGPARERYWGLSWRIRTLARELEAALAKSGHVPASIHGRLRLLRDTLGLTRKELVGSVGVSTKSIEALETGDSKSPISLRRYVRALESCVAAIQHDPSRIPDWIEVPVRGWSAEWDAPSVLLDPELGIVPFHGEARRDQLRQLGDWCLDPKPEGIQSFQAIAGMGKTRLGVELCWRMAKTGQTNAEDSWVVGFLNANRFPSEGDLWSQFSLAGRSLLVVVDYAGHADNLNALRRLIPELTRCPAKRRRLLLLDRTDRYLSSLDEDKGCRQLLNGTRLLRAFDRTDLTDANPLEERSTNFRVAVGAFRWRLGTQDEESPLPNLKRSAFSRVLTLHITALLAALQTTDLPTEEGRILDHLLARERGLRKQRLESRGLPMYLEAFVESAFWLISSNGGAVNEADALRIVNSDDHLRLLSIELKLGVLRVLEDCYSGRDHAIAPLTPDLLGERFQGRKPRVPKSTPRKR